MIEFEDINGPQDVSVRAETDIPAEQEKLPAFGKWVPVPLRKPHPQWDGVKAIKVVDLGFVAPENINIVVNQSIRYVPDARNDFWQNPLKTLDLLTGDCEDFAILKRAYLLASGWSDDQIALIIGHDNILRQNHAVLLVDGKVLDCTHDRLLTPEEMPHFTPVMGMNGTAQWTYGEKL